MDCPMCRESAESLGYLSKVEWFECRYCGWKFAETDPYADEGVDHA